MKLLLIKGDILKLTFLVTRQVIQVMMLTPNKRYHIDIMNSRTAYRHLITWNKKSYDRDFFTEFVESYFACFYAFTFICFVFTILMISACSKPKICGVMQLKQLKYNRSSVSFLRICLSKSANLQSFYFFYYSFFFQIFLLTRFVPNKWK